MKFCFEQIPIVGIAVLILSGLPAFLLISNRTELPPINTLTAKVPSQIPNFTIPLKNAFEALTLGTGSSEISFSIDPPRPNHHPVKARAIIHLPKTKQSIRVDLPTKLGVQFDSSGALQFSDRTDLFWLECNWSGPKEILAALWYKTPEKGEVCREKWAAHPEETPLDMIPNGSPFRELREAKWWGSDLMRERLEGSSNVQRLEIKSEPIDYEKGDWLLYKDNKWGKGAPDDLSPIAHIVGATAQYLELEGWEESGHIRFRLPIFHSPPTKSKGEELFSQLRIRSEKQISCMMDKQCLILRMGDFVVKIKDRWKVLRKKEEKEALLSGKITGECFVLEWIDSKGKNIGGTLYSLKRTSSVPIEYAQAIKKTQPARGK